MSALSDLPAPLPRSVFEQPVLQLAEALLGCLVVRRRPRGAPLIGRVVETEAYGGRGVDPSAHSYRGPTPRCEVMFGAAGHAYVYPTQSACHCLNVTAEGGGFGRAVLLRAVEPVSGQPLMRRRRLARLAEGPTRSRLLDGHDHELARGPGLLCVCFGIDRRQNGVDLCDAGGALYVARGESPAQVLWTPRIGLNPGSASNGWRWRALDAASRSVSGTRVGGSGEGPHPPRCPPG